MLAKAEGYAKRYAPAELYEEVLDYLAVDVTKAVRDYLASDENSVTIESYIAVCVRNRVTKVVGRKHNLMRRFSDEVTDPPTLLDDQIGIDVLLERLSPQSRILAEYAIEREVPLDAYLDAFAIVFDLDIDIENVSTVIEQLQNELKGYG